MSAPDRRVQQEQARQPGMFHRRLIQGTPPRDHVCEVHQRPVRQTHCQVQVPQTHVAVQAQNLLPPQGQGGPGPSREGGLARAALAGHHTDTLSAHCRTPSAIPENQDILIGDYSIVPPPCKAENPHIFCLFLRTQANDFRFRTQTPANGFRGSQPRRTGRHPSLLGAAIRGENRGDAFYLFTGILYHIFTNLQECFS